MNATGAASGLRVAKPYIDSYWITAYSETIRARPLKELLSAGESVPNFVPHLSSKPSQVGTKRLYEKSQRTPSQINAITLNRTQYQLSLDGLLISGLQVRVLRGSPIFSISCGVSMSRWLSSGCV
jgi:hypothetical protein